MIRHFAFYHVESGALHTMKMSLTDHTQHGGFERDVALTCPPGYQPIECPRTADHTTHKVVMFSRRPVLVPKGEHP
jgi:hypothetical protein